MIQLGTHIIKNGGSFYLLIPSSLAIGLKIKGNETAYISGENRSLKVEIEEEMA